MKNINWKKVLPHLLAIAIFFVVAVFYCKPALLDGKVLQQDDTSQWKAMAQSSFKFKETHGHFPRWTNSMFCGMPAYQIALDADNPFSPEPITKITSLFLSTPASFFFLACLCFYFLACVIGCSTAVGIGTALCYAYCTYNPVILVAGHQTKILTIAYIPAFIASLILVFKKRYVIGAGLTAYTTMMIIGAGHLQITYYSIIIVVFMTIAFIVETILNKDFKHLIVAGSISLVAACIGVGTNTVTLRTTAEYGKLSIRGGSALADEKDKNSKATKNGLNKEYAMSYSLYKSEPFVMMYPHIFGASSNAEIEDEKSKAVEKLNEMPQQLANQLYGARGAYWGGIGGTSGPPYVGIIICFLAIVGFVVLDNKYKWWIAACMIFSIMLSWGKYYDGFNTWMLNNLPGYNKFRAPSMILVIPTFLLCFMAALSLEKLLDENYRETIWKKYKTGLIVMGGVFLLTFLMYASFDYSGEGDKMLLKQVTEMPDDAQKNQLLEIIKGFIKALKEDRKSLFLADIIKSIFLVGIAASIIWLTIKNKLNAKVAATIIGLISFADLMIINAKYLNADKYIDVESYDDKNYEKTPTISYLLNDKSQYRVFNVSQGLGEAFNHDAKTSYYLNSIGGYHPAKLSIYQDLIEKQLYNFPNCMPVINMLNTKYIIQGSLAQDTVVNREALGNCWFVKEVIFKDSAIQVMNALTNLNTKEKAVVETYEKLNVKYDLSFDSNATIKLIKNENDFIEYTSNSTTANFAVFSETYYNKGWKAYIDDKEVPIVKTNYVLRGLSIPAGKHKIIFEFKPSSYHDSVIISQICSAIIWLLLIGSLAWYIWKSKKTILS